MGRNRRRCLAVVTAAALLAGCGGRPVANGPATTTTSRPLPTTTAAAADAGTWSLIPAGPNPIGPPVAWTGREVLVAQAGCCDDIGSVNLTAYDPGSETWRALPPTPHAPGVRGWGLDRDRDDRGRRTGEPRRCRRGRRPRHRRSGLERGDRYVARHRGDADDPAQRGPHRGVDGPGDARLGVGAGHGRHPGPRVVLAYNPSTNTWRTLPASGLTPRAHAVVVWTGKELVVWGGLTTDFGSAYDDGARLDPTTGTWRRLPPAPVPGRGQATAVWSGHDVLIWGGDSSAGTEVGKGAAYDPRSNSWRALPLSPLRAKTLPAGGVDGPLLPRHRWLRRRIAPRPGARCGRLRPGHRGLDRPPGGARVPGRSHVSDLRGRPA